MAGWAVVLAGRLVVTGWVVVTGRAVAVEVAAGRAGGGGRAVGVQAQDPAPAVDDGEVVKGAERHQIGQGGGTTPRARDEVVDLAHAGGVVAAGKAQPEWRAVTARRRCAGIATSASPVSKGTGMSSGWLSEAPGPPVS